MATQDPFASMGGGVQLPDGGWVPKDHPLAKQAGAQPAAAPAPTTATPGAPAATNVQDQAKAASTFSATPGAAPPQNTTNAGTADVVRNSYLEQATQSRTIDRNDPVVRQQADAFAGQQERARRQYESEQAERLSAQGLGNSGAMQAERRLAAERAGQAAGSFEAALVGRELEQRRNEIDNALKTLGGLLSGDQARALQEEAMRIDAQLKEAGLAQSGSLGAQELALKDKLGTGGLNIDLMRLLQGSQQFGDRLGFDIANQEAYWNNVALQNLLPR